MSAIQTFSLHGVSARDGLLLKAMIERAAHRLGRSLVYVLADAAQLVFYAGLAPERRLADAHLVKLVDDTAGSLDRALRMPPRATELLELMEALLNRHTVNSSSDAIGQIVRRVYELVGQDRPPYVISDIAGQGLVIFPAERRFAWIGEPQDRLGEALSSRRLSRMTLTPYFEAQYPTLGERRSIEPVLWHLGIAYGELGLLPWIPTDGTLRLRVWPYLVAQAPRSFMKMATALRSKPQSLQSLRSNTDASEADAVSFVNATALCGFLIAETQGHAGARLGTVLGRQSRGGFGRMLGAIRGALGMRS